MHEPATASTTGSSCADHVREATIDSVRQDTPLDRKWAAYMASDTGWTGGDSVYAYAVPKLGTLWTFSDAFLGNVLPDRQRDAQSWIYHNILVVSDHRGFRVVTGGTARDRRPIVSAPSGKFYLLLGGIVEGSIFQAIFQERHTTGVGSLDNVPIGSVIGTFSLPSLRLLSVFPMRRHFPAIQWGSYLYRFGAWTYIYGASSFGLDKSAYVARVHAPNINGRWTYWDGRGWSGSAATAAPLLAHVDQEYSVTPYAGMYVLLSSDASLPFSPYADVYFACSPTGPFVNRRDFALTYNVGPFGEKRWGDGAVYPYDALIQPALSSSGHLVVSYDQNSLHFSAVLNDADIYRPGYLELVLGVRRAR